MAQVDHGHDIPQMDYPEHERTYEGFIALFKWGTIFCVVLVALMAIFLT